VIVGTTLVTVSSAEPPATVLVEVTTILSRSDGVHVGSSSRYLCVKVVVVWPAGIVAAWVAPTPSAQSMVTIVSFVASTGPTTVSVAVTESSSSRTLLALSSTLT